LKPVKQALASLVLLGVVVLLVVADGCTRTIPTAPSVEVWAQGTGYDRLFPVENGAILGALVWKDYATEADQQEFYLSIREKPADDDDRDAATLEAVVKIAVQPIQLQLGPQIRIWRWSVNEEACPALRDALEEFAEVERPALPRVGTEAMEQGVGVHPWTQQLFFRDGLTETTIKVYGLEHPLARWVGSVRASLNECLEKGVS
jgi:hypothetical protein